MPVLPSQPPLYKGDKGPLWQRRRRVWQRGRGWSSSIEYRGDTSAVAGLLPGLLAYCTEVEFEDGLGPYATVTGTWSGFNEGQHDEDLQLVWEIHQQAVELDLLEHPTIKALGDRVRQAIKLSVQQFRQEDASGTIVLPYSPKPLNDLFNSGYLVGDAFAAAMAFFNNIIEGTDHFRASQPIVQRTLVVSEVYATYGASPVSPYVYTTTDFLRDSIAMPDIVFAALPDGEWLESPPQVQQTSLSKFTISQQWEWSSSIDPYIYPNRLSRA